MNSELCIIEHEGSSLLVDIKLIDMSCLMEGHLYQFIGDIKGNLEKVTKIISIDFIILVLTYLRIYRTA
jgi:hypothetical protein